MAKIINKFKANSVWISYYKSLFSYAVILLLLSLAVLYLMYEKIYFGALLILPMLYIIVVGRKNLGILKGGIIGEKSTLALLANLPDDFLVIGDIIIKGSAGSAQIDYIIISPTRIYILEVKNISGILSGKADDRNLKQLKPKSGEIKTPYNPLFQVKRHREVLLSILKAEKIDLSVVTGVYFSNRNLENKIDFSGESVFFSGDEDKMLKGIRNSRSKKSYQPKKVLKTIQKYTKAS